MSEHECHEGEGRQNLVLIEPWQVADWPLAKGAARKRGQRLSVDAGDSRPVRSCGIWGKSENRFRSPAWAGKAISVEIGRDWWRLLEIAGDFWVADLH
jgi:hypothetical protein